MVVWLLFFLYHNNKHLGAEGTVVQRLSYKENRPLSGLFNILFLFIVLCYNVPFALATEPCANLNPGERAYYLGGVIKSFEDKTTNQSIQDILKIPQDSWAHEYTSAPSFGFSTSAYWLKFTVCGSQNPDKNTVLEIGYPLLDFVDLYVVKNENIILTSKKHWRPDRGIEPFVMVGKSLLLY